MHHSNLSSQRVFIVGNDSLFEAGITQLLAVEPGLRVSSAKYMNDLWLLKSIVQNLPHVILLTETVLLDSIRLLGLLIETISVPDIFIVNIRLTDNLVDVYEMREKGDPNRICWRRQFIITKREDLLAVVRGDFHRVEEYESSIFCLVRALSFTLA